MYIDIAKGLRNWKNWSDPKDIERLMELGANRIEELESAGIVGRMLLLRKRINELEVDREKMLKRLSRQTVYNREVRKLVTSLDPDAPTDQLRDAARNLKLITID